MVTIYYIFWKTDISMKKRVQLFMVPFLPIHYFKISMFFDDFSAEMQRYFGDFLP